MKDWIEEKNIYEYYSWLKDGADDVLSNCIVKGYNAIHISDYSEFITKCINWIGSEILDVDGLFFYLICNEEVIDIKSRVERYKKCWKKIADKFDIEKFELGNEFEIDKAGQLFYSGIAKFKADSLENALRILKVKQCNYLLFLSNKNYMKNSEEQKNIIDELILFDHESRLDYSNFFKKCISEGNIPLRYGNVGDEAELALIIPNDKLECNHVCIFS